MLSKRLVRGLVLSAVVTGAACGGEAPAPTLAPIQVAAVTENALMANALMANALKSADPTTPQFMKYLVSCALGPNQSLDLTISGQDYHFPGQVGLAPQWGMSGGSCDGSCQRWVSACLLARLDAAGVEREISVRGLNPALLPSRTELATYTQREATYFGNVFAPGQPRFMCLPPGATSDERVCGDSLSNCPMTIVGSCATDCLFQGPFGEYDLCSDSGKRLSGTNYFESVTVFLPKSTM